MLCVANMDGYFEIVNPAFSRILGYTEKELLSTPFIEFIHPDDVEKTLAELERLREGHPTINFENRYRCVDNSYKWIEWMAVPDKGKLFAIARNITAKKEIEARLSYSELRFRTLFETAPQAILIVDPNSIIVEANQQTKDVFGYAPAEIVGKSLDLLLPDESKEAHQHFLHHFFEQPYVRPMGMMRDLWCRHKSGILVPVSIGLSFIDFDGTRYSIAFVTDVTDRYALMKQLEESLQKSQQSNEELERFAYILSHDLREPLRTVTNFIRLLKNHNPELYDEQAEEMFDFVMLGTQQMNRLIDDLLQYSRITTRANHVDTVNMNDIAARTCFILNNQIVTAQAQIDVDEFPPIRGDATQLQQLLQNLISNAIKFAGDEDPYIRISMQERPEVWEFCLKDNGIGMESRYEEKIFQPFQRLHTQEAYEGSGIGLAICKRIVEQHGGKIWVESELGEGTAFYFTISKSI